MKIEASLMAAAGRTATNNVQQREVQSVRAAGTRPASDVESSVDSAVLSSRAQDVRTAQKAYGELPEVRADRVDALKNQIAQGAFEVDAELIADRLLQDVL